MKTILTHLQSLPEPYRSQAIENYDKVHKNAPDLAHALTLGFIWIQTKQGDQYWINVWRSIITKKEITTHHAT